MKMRKGVRRFQDGGANITGMSPGSMSGQDAINAAIARSGMSPQAFSNSLVNQGGQALPGMQPYTPQQTPRGAELQGLMGQMFGGGAAGLQPGGAPVGSPGGPAAGSQPAGRYMGPGGPPPGGGSSFGAAPGAGVQGRGPGMQISPQQQAAMQQFAQQRMAGAGGPGGAGPMMRPPMPGGGPPPGAGGQSMLQGIPGGMPRPGMGGMQGGPPPGPPPGMGGPPPGVGASLGAGAPLGGPPPGAGQMGPMQGGPPNMQAMQAAQAAAQQQAQQRLQAGLMGGAPPPGAGAPPPGGGAMFGAAPQGMQQQALQAALAQQGAGLQAGMAGMGMAKGGRVKTFNSTKAAPGNLATKPGKGKMAEGGEVAGEDEFDSTPEKKAKGGMAKGKSVLKKKPHAAEKKARDTKDVPAYDQPSAGDDGWPPTPSFTGAPGPNVAAPVPAASPISPTPAGPPGMKKGGECVTDKDGDKMAKGGECGKMAAGGVAKVRRGFPDTIKPGKKKGFAKGGGVRGAGAAQRGTGFSGIY